jgi:hypothetical protein
MRAATVFYLFSTVFFAAALVFFGDALGAPIAQKLAAAWAWVNCFAFAGLSMFALLFAHVCERLERIEQRLAALSRGPTP